MLLRSRRRSSSLRSLTLAVATIVGSWAVGVPNLAQAAPPEVRTSVAPTVGARAGLHPRVALEMHGQARLRADDPAGVTAPAGVRFELGPTVFIGRLARFELRYGYAWGRSPIEGPGVEEHFGQLGFAVGTPADGRIVGIANRTRLDLRGIRNEDDDWAFHVRPRNLTAVFFVVRPWFRPGATFEMLVSPQRSVEDGLQLRGGLMIDGQIDLERNDEQREESRDRPQPSLRWFVASQVGASPIALARAEARTRSDPMAVSTTLDMLVSFGLGGSF